MINPKSNEELKQLIKGGVINCGGEDLVCEFDIDVDASIIKARNIKARNINALDINARNIDARNIEAWDINALDINAKDIKAWNIEAWNIDVWNIDARNIDARNINARDISYYAVCFAYKDIKCESIKGRRTNSKHFTLDGEVKTAPVETKEYLIKDGRKYEVKIIKEVMGDMMFPLLNSFHALFCSDKNDKD